MRYTVNPICVDMWENYLRQASTYALTQDWYYAEAKQCADKVEVCRLLISDELGEPAALAQVIIKRFGFLTAAKVTRGPVLINIDLYNDDQIESRTLQSIRALRKFSIRSWWLLFYISPEICASYKTRTDLERLGFVRTAENAIGSASLELSISQDLIFSNLKGKWRNLLRKAMKEAPTVASFSGSELPVDLIVKTYASLKKEKEFLGIDDRLLLQMLISPNLSKNLYAYLVFGRNDDKNSKKKPAGMVLVIDHGDVCNYLIGYSNSEGRKMNANYLLLWHSILAAKRRGRKIFDLGGLNANTPEGIGRFKRGLNGNEYQLVGEFRRVFNLRRFIAK